MRYLILALFGLITSFVQAEEIRVVLEPRFRTQILSEVTSSVILIGKNLGQPFQKGDVLMTLEDTLYSANQKKAQALLEKADAEYKAEVRLFSDKVSSLQELAGAKANLAVAENNLVIANRALQACKLTAPYAGKVANIYVQLHERIGEGQKLLDIEDNSILIAKLLVPSNRIAEFFLKQPIKIQVQDTDAVVTAIVTEIGTAVDPASSLIRINAEIDNSKGALRSGMVGTIVFETSWADFFGGQ